MKATDPLNLIVTITNGAGVVQERISIASLQEEQDNDSKEFGEDLGQVTHSDFVEAVKEALSSDFYLDNPLRWPKAHWEWVEKGIK
jgi:adenosylcobinamide amidohydrolase